MDKKLAPLVEAINKGKKVTFFSGAGVSTSAGIPDFRSPKTGLYANLAKFDLPFPEAVFDIDYFRENPKAFYTLVDELYPGKFRPTKFHFMLKLFQDKNQLHRVYTQNIDTLDRIAGVEDKYIVEAHGSFDKNHCIDCHEEMTNEALKLIIEDKSTGGIPHCHKCSGLVKPDIVFFGEGLPERFFDLWDDDSEEVEIAIVAGTSLAVYPFAALPSEVGKGALRVLSNLEAVGDFTAGRRPSDIIVLDDCDAFAEALCNALGWEDDLEKYLTKEEIPVTQQEEKEETVQEQEGKEDKTEDKTKDTKDAEEKVQEVVKKIGATAEKNHNDKSTESLEEELSQLDIKK